MGPHPYRTDASARQVVATRMNLLLSAVHPRRVSVARAVSSRWQSNLDGGIDVMPRRISIANSAASPHDRQRRCTFDRDRGRLSLRRTERRADRGIPYCADTQGKWTAFSDPRLSTRLALVHSTHRTGSTPYRRSSSRPFDHRPGWRRGRHGLTAHIRMTLDVPPRYSLRRTGLYQFLPRDNHRRAG